MPEHQHAKTPSEIAEHATTKPGGKHPSASASKSTSRPAGKSTEEYPPNSNKHATEGAGKGVGGGKQSSR
ncbi:hypothetical protein HDU87_004810 [Geranomyces variabilis]|uniref:Uncharacterized protein n=1 Tax=Geranomyces variabilis TaxID=109894 RepID=A0AAD5XPN0_9FUNG|nr:hypothetical protein HDU87_004810 [Geranomyces variabilis]